MSLATTLHRSKGGQFIADAKALPGNPYDGHTLATVIPEIEAQIGATLSRIVADRGYRGHNAPPGHKFKVYISGQRRRASPRPSNANSAARSAVEPVIGHAKSEHLMGRNYLAGAHGDAANAVPCCRRRLQLQTPARMAGPFVVLDPRRVHRRGQSGDTAQIAMTAFFTGDCSDSPRTA